MEKMKILKKIEYSDTFFLNNLDDTDKNSEFVLIEKLPKAFKYILQILIIITLIIGFYNKNEWNNIPISESIIFMKKCFEGLLLNNNPLKYTHNCKISVVIPVYNS